MQFLLLISESIFGLGDLVLI